MNIRACAATGLLVLLCTACPKPEPGPKGPAEIAGTQAFFDLDADLGTQASYYNFPWPSDLRLTSDGRPDLTGYPNFNNKPEVVGLLAVAAQRKGFPTLAAGYFKFSEEPAQRDATTLIPASVDAPLMLLDVDPDSPDVGRQFPVMAATPLPDDYTDFGMLAVAARPGIILRPLTTYAFVVMRSANDRAGNPLGVPLALEQLKAGVTPSGARGAAAASLYAPLWAALDRKGIPRANVAAATVFTTGDVVADTNAMIERVVAAHDVTLDNLAVDPVDGDDHATFCELKGTVAFPQFQQGEQPFNTGGSFVLDANDTPIQQGTMTVPFTITLPKQAMPAGGYPLLLYVHGSGGSSTDVVDKGPQDFEDGPFTPGTGPAAYLSPYGLASAQSAMPVNPERLPNASDYAYLNLANPSSFRDTFRQGMIEQHLFVDALLQLAIPPATVASCTGLSLPAGETAYRFNNQRVMAAGNSMGGMYTNLVGATDARIKAVTPTGAGGYWGFFIFQTKLIEGAGGLLALYLGTMQTLTFLHPVMHLLELTWEPAEPVVYMPRLALRPLPGHPARDIFQPVGKDDAYFPPAVLDVAALSYGNEQAGSAVWPSMQEALALDGRDGILGFPVADNLTSENGEAHTGAVVQYEPLVTNGHYVYRQRPDTRFQIACFFDTFWATGVGKVVPVAAEGSPCPR